MADWRKDRVIIGGLMLMMFGVFFVGETKAKSLEELGMVFVKGGCYKMGDTFGDGGTDEKPVHEVCLDDFYIGQYEVTVGEFKAFVDETGIRRKLSRKVDVYTLNLGESKGLGSGAAPGFRRQRGILWSVSAGTMRVRI